MRIGVLFLQGGAIEHENAFKQAAKSLGIKAEFVRVRSKEDFAGLGALAIPGGESTVLQKLLERKGMVPEIEKVPRIIATCAGLILISSKIEDGIPGQKPIGLLDVAVKRNAYGSQLDSFECELESRLGKMHAAFIRAPKITQMGKGVRAIAAHGSEPVAVLQEKMGHIILATTFHPELTTSAFHEMLLSG